MARAYGLKGSADYLWERKKREDNKLASEFTQVYELILSRRLQPLYDASLKFEFRTESKDEAEDKERTKLLPSLNMRFGHEMLNINTGWSEDYITEKRKDTNNKIIYTTYTNERLYAGLGWKPKKLPHILIQFQEEGKESEYEDPNDDKMETIRRIILNEDYAVTLGRLTFDHSFNHERKDTVRGVTATYDLLNIGRIGNRFSFLNNKLDIQTGFESRQGQDKQEDGDINRTLKHNANFSIIGYPLSWMRPEYRAFWGEDKRSEPDERETSIGQYISLFLNPNPYLPSTIGMDFNRTKRNRESGPRDVTTYSFKMEPSLQGLIFDPNTPMYPINTSFLASRSTEESMGSRQTQTWSFLLTGSTGVYQGVDLDLDMGLSRRRDFKNDFNRSEERIDGHLNLDLLPTLKGSIRQELEWIRYHGSAFESKDFDGSLETKLLYRPVETFMLDAGYTLDYEGKDSGYEFDFHWLPTSKIELDVSYQSSTEEKDEYFSSELNINMTKTLRLELRYQYPAEDQLMKVQFTVRF